MIVSLPKGSGNTRECVDDLLGEAGRTAPAAGAVDGRSLTNSHRAVGADVVLVGTVLATLGGDTLELLLGRGIGVADLHDETLLADGDAVKALDDLLTDITGLETVMAGQSLSPENVARYLDIPSETDTTGVAHAVTQDLAGEDLVGRKDGDKLLSIMSVRYKSGETTVNNLQPR